MPDYFKSLKKILTAGEEDYTSGSINRAIVLLSIPMVLEMLMEGLFALVDAYFVAKYDPSGQGIATIGFTETVITIVYSLAIGLSAAATAMVARRVGEKKPDEASKAAMQATIIAVLLSIVLGVGGVAFAEDILAFMGGSPELIAECSGYTKIMFGGNIVIFLIFLFNAIFRGAGNAVYAMYVLWISNGINIVLDPMLIFGWGPFPEMGITGAAVASTIGRGIGVTLQLMLLIWGVGIVRLARRHLVVMKDLMWRIIKVAAGGAGQYFIMSASWIFLTFIIGNYLGETILAGYYLAIRIIIFTFMPIWGLSNAAATLVGQNLGAEKPDRAETSAWRTAHFTMGVLSLLGILLIVFAPQIVSFFKAEPEVMESAILALRIFSVGYMIFGYGLVLSQSFNGAGDTKTPTRINFVCFWLIETPLAYVLAISLGMGIAGICWSVVAAESLMSIIFIYLFRKGNWKKTVI